ERPPSADDVGRRLAGLRPGRAREAEEANPLGRLAQGQFVGRREELDRLHALLDGALAGRGALALVAGDAGIGKTRLVEELAAYGGLRGARVLWGRCYEGDGAPAYWPWVQIVRAYLAVRPPEAWAAEMGAGAPAIARVVPEVGEAPPDAADESPEEARFRFFEAMGGFVRNAAAADRPLVLVLDDLHWADTASLLLLGFLAQEARSAPVLVVGTYRDVEVGRDHALTRVLGDVRAAERITLAGLPEGDVARFLEARSGAAPHPRLVAAAYERTEGNPFFLSEVMRLLVSEGGLEDHPERALAVPAGVRDVLTRRLDRLSEGTRELLGVAAAIGRDFGLDVLQRASGAGADAVLDALDEAVEAQVVVTGRAGRFRFNHALVRETIYDELGTVRRLRLHLKVGEALEAVHGRAREAHVAELAHHWFEALPVAGADKAVEYSTAAAVRSHAALAFEEAARHYDRACRALELAGLEDDPRRIELLLARGEEQTHAGEVEPSHETFREAAELARAQGLPELQAKAALGFAQWSVLGRNDPAVALLEEALDALPEADSSCRAEVLAELAIHLEAADHRARKDALSAAAVAMARRAGDRAQLALLLANRHATIWGPDNLDERLALADEGLALALEVGDRSRERWAHFLRFVDRLESGDVATADRALDEFARTADELGQPFYRWYAALMRRTRALMDGAMADAERLGHELGELWHSDDGDDVWARTVQDIPLRWQQGRLSEVRRALEDGVRRYASIPAYRCLLAWVDAETGRVDAARRELDRLVGGGLAELPCDEQWLAAVANLAAAAAAIGHDGVAGALRERLAPHASRLVLFDAGWACLGPCARHLGVLAELQGERDAAVAHLEHALALAAT
ncbi:MAG TPA: AAA family ATPase, partial [Solirubrobacteraceae bacterium]